MLETNPSGQPIETIILCSWSEDNIGNAKGIEAFIEIEITRVVMGFKTYEQTKEYMQKAVKQN